MNVVEEPNQPIGVVRRRDVFRLRANFRTVHVLIFNGRGELLLHRLTWTRDREPGRGGSSAAGYLHAGEDRPAAARRRRAEELSLSSPRAEDGGTCSRDDGASPFARLVTGTA